MLLEILIVPLLHQTLLKESLEGIRANIRIKEGCSDSIYGLLLGSGTFLADFILSKFALVDETGQVLLSGVVKGCARREVSRPFEVFADLEHLGHR